MSDNEPSEGTPPAKTPMTAIGCGVLGIGAALTGILSHIPDIVSPTNDEDLAALARTLSAMSDIFRVLMVGGFTLMIIGWLRNRRTAQVHKQNPQ